MDRYIPRRTRELCKHSFLYKGSMLWNNLPDMLKESSSLDVFKSIIGWQISEYIWAYLSIDLHFLILYIFPVHTVYWGTYVYLKSWCLYLTFRVLYNMVFVAYFRKIYRIFYGMTFILCWYAICLFVKCGIILCFKQGSKVQQFHGLVIPCINILK